MTPLSLYDIQHIAQSLRKSSRNGQGWTCCCPSHEDKTPSLSLALGHDGTLLVHCHAGCSFEEIVTILKRRGLLPDYQSNASSSRSVRASQTVRQKDRKDQEKAPYTRHKAQELWYQAQPPQETLVETYLRSRLRTCFKEIPPTIRFSSSLRHTPSGRSYPCMVAAVTHYPSKEVVAVHRTYLAFDGKGKAPVENPKMLLGEAKGGAIRLGAVTEELILCEGIEDGLSLLAVLNKPVWVGCSASLLQTIVLPPLPLARIVYIARDNDEAGQKATEILGNRLYAEERKVKILTPPQSYKDFNSILQHRQNQQHFESFAQDSIELSGKKPNES